MIYFVPVATSCGWGAFRVAILEVRKSQGRAEEIRQAQKIKVGLSPELKAAIKVLADSIRKHTIPSDQLEKLTVMKLVEKKFGLYHLTSLGRIVSMI